MAKINHEKRAQADRLRRNGTQGASDFGVLFPDASQGFKSSPAKAALRNELDAAIRNITHVIKCPCGHSAEIALPASWTGRRLRCSQCGEIAK